MPFIDYEKPEVRRRHAECEFLAKWLDETQPQEILDIGSYDEFNMGVAAFHKITTLDLQKSLNILPNKKAVVGDARNIPFSDNSFDFISTLNSIRMFGLTAYMEELDWEADEKAIKEMIRVLKPNGHLLITTRIQTRGRPVLYFNSERRHTYQTFMKSLSSMKVVEEKFFDEQKGEFTNLGDAANDQCFLFICLKK